MDIPSPQSLTNATSPTLPKLHSLSERTISRSLMMLSRISSPSSMSSQAARRDRILISRMAVMGNPSRSFSILIFLMATVSPVSLSWALNTSP